MDQSNIMFMENMDNSYTMVDLYQNNKFFGYKDSYNYYDIDVKKILLIKNSYNEYFIRYYDVNKMMIVPLQLKINDFYNEINTLENNTRVLFIYDNDKDVFRKCIEVWNKITESIVINNTIYFLKADDDDKLFIMEDENGNNTSFVFEDDYRYRHNKVVIALHSVINDCIKTSLVQHRY